MAEAGAPSLRIGWELAQSLGLLAALCSLLLCLLPVRPRIPGTPPLSLRKHELLGWSMLIAALGHVGLSLAFDRAVTEHLKLTAPLYEWAGICALLASLVLTVPAAGRLRRQLWSRHRDFQALHVAVSCALVALIAVHVVTTNRYLHGPGRVALWLLLSVAALLALLRPRAQHPAARTLGAISRLAFGRHSRLILICASVAALAVVPLLKPNVRLALRASPAAAQKPCRSTSRTISIGRSTAFSATIISVTRPAPIRASAVTAAAARKSVWAQKPASTISVWAAIATRRLPSCGTAPPPDATRAM